MPSGPPRDGVGPLEFAYHRAIAPMMWMFLSIAIAELLLVHGLVAIWHPFLAIGLSLVSLLGIVWMIALIRSLRRHPVVIGEDFLRFRLGHLRDVEVPIKRVASLRTRWPPRFHKRKGVLNLAMLSFPNILVELDAPLERTGGRPVWAIAHRLDRPEAFAAALRERLSASRRDSGPPAWFV